jgi:zinc/manganese transport system substrate-binding protein
MENGALVAREGACTPSTRHPRPGRPRARLAALAIALAATLAGCGVASGDTVPAGVIGAVGAENQYASVIKQIGGRYVQVSAIESNPNTDPHTFEASPSVAQEVSSARLVVQNGLGYDSYMEKIEAASPSSSRRVVNVQRLLGLPDSTPNPHLWYSPQTMPAVANAVAGALAALQPAHAAYFRANEARFTASLAPWTAALAELRSRYPASPVATTEPVGDYLLEAAGTNNLTPFAMQADVMNGVDLAPQDVALQLGLLSGRRVKAFLYNRQVVDSTTESFFAAAHRAGVPVVGLYETMPTPGYDYQSWMLAATRALRAALASGASTETL